MTIFIAAVVYTSYAFLLLFATLSIASGLYYIAEIVEEYTQLTKKILHYSILIIIVLHTLFWLIESYPFQNIAFGILSHIIYYTLLQNYPLINLTDPKFIASCVFAVIDHIIWFRFFTQHYFPFPQILAFFLFCVWLTPFVFFISLSANENVLPTTGLTKPLNIEEIPKNKRKNRIVSMLNYVKKSISSWIPERFSSGSRKTF
eukprot:TRINITY_DN3828_c0_g1_i1.p1 TRINITY_DN3828_c0_g1~~TRINITY_DN3828_c0_g1_i1.p1  ORF type:complete len:203 (-),score=15.57 TRINITY_DN3828_c0_g1_i1:7-615(-)